MGLFLFLHTLVVEHNGQDGDAVAHGYPVHAAGHGKHVSAVADNLHDKPAPAAVLRVRGELDAERGAAGPAEAAAAAVDPRAGQRRLDVVVHKGRVGDGLDGPDGVFGTQRPELAAQMAGSKRAVFQWLGGLCYSSQSCFVLFLDSLLMLDCVSGLSAELCRLTLELVDNLPQSLHCIGAISGLCLDVGDGHQLFQRIHVNVENNSVVLWLAAGRNPRHVAVDHQNNVGLFDALVHAIAHAQAARVGCWEAHVAAAGVEDLKTPEQADELLQRRRELVVAAAIASNDQRPPGASQRTRNVHGRLLPQPSQLDRQPVALPQRVRRNLGLHDLARAAQVHRPLRIRRGKLQRAVDQLLDVGARLDLTGVAAVLRDNGLLARHVLHPVDVLGAAAAVLAVEGNGGEAGKDEDGRAAGRGVVDGRGEGLRADVDVDNDALRLARETGVAVSHGHGNHLG